MSNRKSAEALTRDLLLQIIRFRGGMAVNAEGGIGSKNPHLVRLIADGLVKLVRHGSRMELTNHKAYRGTQIRRTVAVPADGSRIDKVVCPSCGELCGEVQQMGSAYRWVHERHKFNCEVRRDHLYDRFDRAQEARNAKQGRPTDVGVKMRFSTRRGKRRDKKRRKVKRGQSTA